VNLLAPLFVLLLIQLAVYPVTGRVLLNDKRPGEFASSIQLELARDDRPGEVIRGLVNSDGEYRFMNLRSGAYVVTASAPGFKQVRSQFEVIGINQVRGNTRLILMPENATTQTDSSLGTVSPNELKAPRKAVKEIEEGENELDKGNLETAGKAVLKALNVYPRYARAYFLQGRIREKQNRIPEAIESYRQTIAEDPNHYPAYAALAEIFRVGSNHSDLAKTAEAWKRAQPLNAAPYYYSALALYESGQPRFAVDEALMATRFPHAHIRHLNLLLANCYLKLGEAEAAASQMKEFLELYPEDRMVPQVQTSLATLEKILQKK
jgi:tetratricopeptide (TPR) repeat protein